MEVDGGLRLENESVGGRMEGPTAEEGRRLLFK
jgi:hypothetical protein